MKQYKSHKVVEAAKIAEVGDRGLILVGEHPIYPSAGYFEKHKPQAGGYFVRYPDGYESFSPAEAFESGYTDLAAAEEQLEAQIAQEPILKFFTYKHLPAHLQMISRPWCVLALQVLALPRSAERTVALRKLLEGKDAAVRAGLP